MQYQIEQNADGVLVRMVQEAVPQQSEEATLGRFYAKQVSGDGYALRMWNGVVLTGTLYLSDDWRQEYAPQQEYECESCWTYPCICDQLLDK